VQTAIPFSALVEEDWGVLATYRQAVEEMRQEAARGQ
jgi:hypothetical protein